MVDFGRLSAESDVVSLHVPLMDEARDRINVEALRTMKPGAFPANTPPGAVVDARVRATALRDGLIGGAGRDASSTEPPTAGDPLIMLWREQTEWPVNSILPRHTGSNSESGMAEIRIKAADEVAHALTGRPLRNCINGEHLVKPRSGY